MGDASAPLRPAAGRRLMAQNEEDPPMSRLPLAEPQDLPPYLKAIHDATPEENWLGRHFDQTLRV